MLNRTALIALTITSASTLAGPAFAHAHLKQSTPMDKALLHASPPSIRLEFSEGLEPAFSHLQLTTQSGMPVSLGTQTIGGDDGTTLAASPAAPLAPGTYSVTWQVLSKDGHKTSGTFAFSVAP